MNVTRLRQRVWQDPMYFLAFGFGSGLSPVMPGTMGTLMAIPLYVLMAQLCWPIYLGLTFVGLLWGIWASNKITIDLGIEDYKGIVWDEIIGYLLTLFLMPPQLSWMLIGFFLFRLFDIWKPYPISLLEKKVKGGLGIMLDDVLAALFARVILQMLVWLVHI